MKFQFKLKSKDNQKDKSIKTQLTLIIVCFAVISCVFLGSITSFLTYKSSEEILSKTVVETTKQASENAAAKIKNVQNAAIQTGIMQKISDPKVSVEEKQEIIKHQEKLYGLALGQIIDVNGKDIFSGKDYSERDYFKISMSGKEYLSSPVISKVTGDLTLVVSAPIWKDGIQGSEIVGVVSFDPPKELLNDIVKGIQVSENSYAYLIDSEGTVIGHKDESRIGVANSIKESQTDESQMPFAEADKKLISGQTGYTTAKFDGQRWMLGYAPVSNSNGWGIGVMANAKDFMGSTYRSMIITAITTIVVTIIAFAVAIIFSNKIGNPLKSCSERLKSLAEGDLNSDTIELDANNEIGLVADATTNIVEDLRSMINELTYMLTEVSNGNLDVEVDNEHLNELFKNDFAPILLAVNKIVEGLNDTLSQINVAGEQVSVGSDQVAEGAQLLSQGATEQASSVQELSATINEVSMQVKQTAQNAERAKQISIQSSAATEKGKKQMQEMIAAMNEISNTSNQIGNIIKNIDDIAFQTNILALNAAVEAARAGEAGKGFAVVADEVRNLAAKSAQSAKDTAELIEKSLLAIENGSGIVSETAKSLEEVVSGAQKSADVIQEIANASNEQAQHINQVNIGVEQISVVVQTNSATAEESAAASEELSSQAEMLKELIGKFKLKEEQGGKFFDGKILFDSEEF